MFFQGAKYNIDLLDALVFHARICRFLLIWFGWNVVSMLFAMGNGFVPNQGQWSGQFEYRLSLPNHEVFLTNYGMRIVVYEIPDHPHIPFSGSHRGVARAHSFDIIFEQAVAVRWRPHHVQPYYYNYYLGRDPMQWRSRVPVYKVVTASDIWQGIDVRLESDGKQFKMWFEVGEDAQPKDIRLRYMGIDSLSLLPEGHLQIHTCVGVLTDLSPSAYTLPDSSILPIAFELASPNQVRFSLPSDVTTKLPIAIDPIYIFSTYSGSYSDNWGFTATPDTLGNGYAGGTVYGVSFPVTTGAFDPTYNGGGPGGQWLGDIARDVAIWKVNAVGTQLLFATFLGGSGDEQPHSMVVDHANRLVVMGTTESGDFPVTPGAFQTNHMGMHDIFISIFSEDGTQLSASTLMGGTDRDGLNGYYSQFSYTNILPTGYNYGDVYRGEVITAANGDILVASSSRSSNFPITFGAYDGSLGGPQDGVCFRLSNDLKTLKWSSYIGGGGTDAAYGLREAVDGSIYVVGGTTSANAIDATGGAQPSYHDSVDGFILRLSATGTQRLAGTYIGTNAYDQVYLVDLNETGEVYVVGQTESSQFPQRNAPASVPGAKHFIVKLTPALDSVLISGTFGLPYRSQPDLAPSAFMVDECGRIYFSGWAESISRLGSITGYPITPNAYQKFSTGQDFYLSVWNDNMQALLYASFYGGAASSEHVDGGTSRFSKDGTIFQSVCAGCGGNSDFPTYPANTISTTNNSANCNNALFKIHFDLPPIYADFISDTLHCAENTFRFINRSSKSDSLVWHFGDGHTSHSVHPTHTYDSPGTYTVVLEVYGFGLCDGADTDSLVVHAYDQSIAQIGADSGECINIWHLRNQSPRYDSFVWYRPPSHIDSSPALTITLADTTPVWVYLITDPDWYCADTDSIRLQAPFIPTADFTYQITDSCLGSVRFINQSTPSQQWEWSFGDNTTDTLNWHPIHSYDSPGTYHVRLVIEPGKPCADTAEQFFSLDRIYAALGIYADSCVLKSFQWNRSLNYDSIYWEIPNEPFPYSTADSFSYTWPDRGWYVIRLIATRMGGCADTAEAKIWVNTRISPTFDWTIDTCNLQIIAQADSPVSVPFGWRWNRYLIYPGQYHQTLAGDEGPHQLGMITQPTSICADSLVVTVNLPAPDANLFIPNIFTPNDDGFNETFFVRGVDQCEYYHLYVYNRWGQVMFYHGDPPRFAHPGIHGDATEWDGTFENHPVPEGAYYYLLITPYYTKQGTLRLVR